MIFFGTLAVVSKFIYIQTVFIVDHRNKATVCVTSIEIGISNFVCNTNHLLVETTLMARIDFSCSENKQSWTIFFLFSSLPLSAITDLKMSSHGFEVLLVAIVSSICYTDAQLPIPGCLNIDPLVEICCNNVLQPLLGSDPGNTQCCSQQSFDPLVKICCNNILSAAGPNTECCGSQSYETTVNICCNNVLSTLTGSNDKCCGSQSYDTTVNICCNNVLSTLTGSNTKCCGSKSYDTTVNFCCNNVLSALTGSNTKCCGSETYDSTVSICCNNVLSALVGPNTECCGTTSINPEVSVCCNNVPVSASVGC